MNIPSRIKALPVDPKRKLPIPYFVKYVDGEPDFRLTDEDKAMTAYRENRCWICGQHNGSYLAFNLGPMAIISKISAEPPAHLECAVFAAEVCPFLARPHMRRREGGLPEAYTENLPDGQVLKNPGIAIIWVTKKYTLGPGLFMLGKPTQVLSYVEGRLATKEEIIERFEACLPEYREKAGETPAVELAINAARRALGI